MLTIGLSGFDSLLIPLALAALAMGLLRAALAVCARVTQVRDARWIASAHQIDVTARRAP